MKKGVLLKIIKNREEIIRYLYENKKCIVNESEQNILFSIGYVNLITPYKHFFHKGTDFLGKHIYNHEKNVIEYKKLYDEDIEQTIIIREIIYQFEKLLKSLTINLLSDELKNEQIVAIEQGNEYIINKISYIIKRNKGNKYSEYLKSILKEFSMNDKSFYLTINKFSIVQLKNFINIFKFKEKEINLFFEYYHTIRTLRNSISHGDTIQMHLNRLTNKEYHETTNVIKKIDKFNLEKKENINYLLYKKSYDLYNKHTQIND